jgi:hypothetical protein
MGGAARTGCPTGRYGNKTSQWNESVACHICEKGYYCKGVYSKTACSVGKYADQEELDECKNCDAGKYGKLLRQTVESEACHECPRGSYCEGGEAGKQFCPQDYYGDSPNLKTKEDCKKCSEGKYGVIDRPGITTDGECNVSKAWELEQEWLKQESQNSQETAAEKQQRIDTMLDSGNIDPQDTKNSVSLMKSVTKDAKNLSPEAQEKAAEIVDEALTIALNNSKAVDDSILENCADAASNILRAAEAPSTPMDSAAGDLASAVAATPEQKKAATKMAKKLSNVMGSISVLQANSMKVGEKKQIETPTIQMSTEKVSVDDMKTSDTTIKGAVPFVVPSSASGEFQRNEAIAASIIGWKINPYAILSDSKLNSEVVSFTLRVGKLEQEMKNLADPISFNMHLLSSSRRRRHLKVKREPTPPMDCSKLLENEVLTRMESVTCPTWAAIVYVISACMGSCTFLHACYMLLRNHKHSLVQANSTLWSIAVALLLTLCSSLCAAFVCNGAFKTLQPERQQTFQELSRNYERQNLTLLFTLVLTAGFVALLLVTLLISVRLSKHRFEEIWMYIRHPVFVTASLSVPILSSSMYLWFSSRLYKDWVSNDISVPDPDANVTCVTTGYKNETLYTEQCKYWDDGGSWSTKGCTTSYGKNGVIACACNHLTDFSVAYSKTVSRFEEIALGEKNSAYRELQIPLLTGLAFTAFVITLLVANFLDIRRRRKTMLRTKTYFSVLAAAKLKRNWLISIGGLKRMSRNIRPLMKKRRESVLQAIWKYYRVREFCSFYRKRLIARHDITAIIFDTKPGYGRSHLFSIFITRIVLKCSVTAVFFELKKTKNDLEITTEQMLVILFTFALNKMVGIFLRKLFVKFVLSDRVRSVKLYRKLSQKRLKRTKKKKKGENWMLPSHVNRKYSFTAIFVWSFILSLNTVNISFLLLFGFQLKREGDIKHALFLRCVLLSIGSWVFLTSPLRILFFSVQSWSKLLQSDRGKRKRGETRRRLRTEKLALVQKQSSPERESVSVEMASRISMSPNKHTSRESLRRASYLESTKRLELVTSKKHAAKSKKVKTQKLEGGGREKETIPEENVVVNPLWKGSSKKKAYKASPGNRRPRRRAEKLALVQKQSSLERESVSVEMASRISMSPNKHTSRESLRRAPTSRESMRRASYLESTKRLELVTSKKHAAKSKKVKTQKLEGGGREKETIPEENVVVNPLWKGSSKKMAYKASPGNRRPRRRGSKGKKEPRR